MSCGYAEDLEQQRCHLYEHGGPVSAMHPICNRIEPNYSAAYTGAPGKKLAQANQNSLRC